MSINPKKSTPVVVYAEYSGICIHAVVAPEVCPICGSELAGILRKARNA